MASARDNQILTEVGPGTPMGMLLRHYWLPALMSSEIEADGDPVRVMLLGEKLVAFRDSAGKVGVMDHRCPHRCASLFFGRNEEGGIRCVYHGWKFDTEGNCLDMANVPPHQDFKHKVHAKAYPSTERDGVVWVYMGDEETVPELPGTEVLQLPDEEMSVSCTQQECNWLQALEGDIDISHADFLHGGTRTVEDFEPDDIRRYGSMHRDPEFDVQEMPYGILYGARRPADPGEIYCRIAQYMMPFWTITPSEPFGEKMATRAWVPMDDSHSMLFNFRKKGKRIAGGVGGARVGVVLGGRWRYAANSENDYQMDREKQRSSVYTGIMGSNLQDQAITESMGTVVDRTLEHLAPSDAMITATRRRLLGAVKAMKKDGAMPPGARDGDRDDVTWSDGEKFDADDVVYTFQYLTDSKVKLRFKRNFAFIARIEKTGSDTVRLVAKRPTPFDMARLSSGTYIYPEHIRGPIKNKRDFGKKPVGTGPYKFTQVNKNTGAIAVLRGKYPQASKAKPAPTIGRLIMRSVPDTGAQIAEILAGNIDAVKDIPIDQVESLAKRPNIGISWTVPFSYQYLLIDAKGRSGVEALKDIRVRQAIHHAINTKAMERIIGGNTVDLKRPPALCIRQQFGCDYSAEFLKHDPAKAKKLLAEAGASSGLAVKIVARAGQGKTIAEVLIGQLRAVGIPAALELHTLASYRKVQGAGKINLLVSGWGGGGIADVASTLSFLFSRGPRDYHGNKAWLALSRKANSEMDDRRRRAMVAIPRIWVHSKDLKMASSTSPFFPYGASMSHYLLEVSRCCESDAGT